MGYSDPQPTVNSVTTAWKLETPVERFSDENIDLDRGGGCSC